MHFHINNRKIFSRDYSNLFCSGYFFKSSCYKCSFATLNRNSDITLADAWGIKKNNSEFNDDKGVSLIFLNSKKSRKIFTYLDKYISYKKIDINRYLQPNMQAPTEKNPKIIKCNIEQSKILVKNKIMGSIVRLVRTLGKG